MRILCLHGYTQNASLFAKKSSGLRKLLSKAGHELVYVDGPFKVEVGDLPFEASPEMIASDMRSWWSINESNANYADTEVALETVRTAIKESGPFDGVLGFSQGAGLTAIVTKALHTHIDSNHPPLKFAIIYSGFRLKGAKNQHWYESNFTTPALHVMGTLDTVVSEERSQALLDLWSPSIVQVLKHPGGHYIPSQRPMLEAVLAFVDKHQTPVESVISDKASDTADEWDEFDTIGK